MSKSVSRKRLFKWFIKSLFLLIALLLISYWLLPKPELVSFTTYSRAYLDKDENLLRLTLAEDDRYRLYTKLDDISQTLVDATVLYEDKNFYQHGGVNFPAIARAFWTTYISGSRRVGASTITMQVARLRWQVPSNTLSGKIHQIFRAIQITRHYSKQQILESYLNLAPYGGNIEGIGAASLIYFNKKASELSLIEAITLSVIPQNPNKRSPSSKKGIEALKTARLNLFNRWIVNNPEHASQAKFLDLPLRVRSSKQLPFLAPHFINYMARQISRWDAGYVHTSLSSNTQRQLEKVLLDYVGQKKSIGINNASALLLNYKTMNIEAMVGSANFFDLEISGQVNGVLAKRSPGSTLKPFVYGLAMDEGLIHPMSLLKDSPVRFAGFTPENYDKQFLGPVLARDALILSRNVPAVTLQAKLKQQSFFDFLKKAKVSKLKSESFYGLALALGGGELTMLEIAQLYAMLANQGQHQQASGFASAASAASTAVDSTQLLSAEASFMILDILKDNPAPDALNQQFVHQQSNNLKNNVPWKTGTSWAFRDAWAIGISGDYVLAVWVGNFDGTGNSAFVGRSAAGPLLFTLLDSVVRKTGWSVAENLWTRDLNIKQVAMCKNTGDLPGKYCKSTEDAWFVPGVSPIKVSTVYRAVPILKSSGLRACWFDPKFSEMKVFEFWRSDFLTIFKQAGISLKTPPPFADSCSLDQKSTTGMLPIIRSPQSTIEYVLQAKNTTSEVDLDETHEDNLIALTVTVDPDVKKVFWFIDEQFVGEAEAGKVLFWKATSGNHQLRIVDDSGRAASSVFKVIVL